jgi:Holliday junction resolvase RusA-like endonuclease
LKIIFRIPGRLRGKGRPRFVRATGRTYTDEKTQANEAVIRHFAEQAMAGRPPLEGPVKLDIIITINHPKSWSAKRKEVTKWVTGKPDADNIIKSFDGANGILWGDDSQIAVVSLWRMYAAGPEGAQITVESLLLDKLP